MHPCGLSGWCWATDLVTLCTRARRKASYGGWFSWPAEVMKRRMKVKTGMEMSCHRKRVTNSVIVPFRQAPASSQVMSCFLLAGRFCGKEATGRDSCRGQASPFPAENSLHWVIIANITVEKPTLCLLMLYFELFKMHLLIKSYKYQIQLIFPIFCPKWNAFV